MAYDRIAKLDDNQFVQTISQIDDDIEALKNRQYIGGVGVKTYVTYVSTLLKQNYDGSFNLISTDSRSQPTDALYDFKHTLPIIGPGSSDGTNFFITFTPDNQEYPVVVPGAYMYIDSPTNMWDISDFSATGVYGGFYVTQTNVSASQPYSGVKPTGQTWTIEENKPAFKTFYFNVQRWTSVVSTTIYVKAFIISTDTGTAQLYSNNLSFGANDAF